MARALNLVGDKYGMLTVVEKAGISKNGHTNWICQCECGNVTIVNSGHLREKRGVKSCGCLCEKVGERTYKHGASQTKLYDIWIGMKERCENRNHKYFADYGGRGIKVCPEWQEFIPFMEWSYKNGYDENAKRGDCTIDRKNVNGNYEPSNCRWVNMKTQSRNRRNTLIIEYNGRKEVLSKLCEDMGINYTKVRSRMQRGRTFEEAIKDIDKDLRGKYERKGNLLSKLL